MTKLLRVRWGVRAALVGGVAASVAGNVLHARGGIVSQVIAAWSPLALLVTIELIARVPVHRRGLAAARWAATALIAGIAAWVSYWHMAGVALRYGETSDAAHLLPLSVDGLIVVASICLVELGGRIRAAEESTEGESDGLGTGGERDAEGDVRPDREEHAGERAGGAEGHQQDHQAVAEVSAQFEPPTPPARKPHTTNPDRVRRAYERNPDADPAEVARRLKLSPATVKRYRPPKEQPEPVNGKVPDLELEGANN